MRTPSLLVALCLLLPSPARAQGNVRETVEGTLPRSWSTQLSWRSIGPANMGGRITCIAAHPTDPSSYWIGCAGGGLLKTVNNGLTYEHQFTNGGTNSIGAVAVAPSNPDEVWVGTGENNPRNSVSWGDGVYHSKDGGKTFEHAGLSESFQISTIIVHPTDPKTVYVGALGRLWGENEERGLFKTTDGGESWEKVLSIDDKTGVIDIRMKPDDPDVLLAATYERKRDIYDSNDPAHKWGPGSGLWRSEDGGASWVKVTEGLPTVLMGRIGLDWYQGDPNIVYAVIETERITQEPPDAAYAGIRGEDAEVGARLTRVMDDGPAKEAELKKGDIIVRAGDQIIVGFEDLVEFIKAHKAGDEVTLELVRDGEAKEVKLTLGHKPQREDDTDELGYPRPGPYSGGLGGQRENIQDEQGEEGFQYGGVYRSEDAGKSWTRINSLDPRPMYYSEIRVDPSDDSYVYVLGTALYRSEDGGKTFTPDGARGDVHVDHHALWIDPRDGRHMILGNDGGIYVTWDRMQSWDHHNHVAIGQFYNVTCGPREDYWVYGGLQDNGSWGGPTHTADGGPVNSDWIRIGGGDGFVCRVDAEDPDQVYSESQNGGMGWRNLRTGEGGFARPSSGRKGLKYRFNWNTPFILSSHNSRILYSAGNYVFRSLNRGRRAKRISPKISVTERGTATALHESPIDPDVLYVGTDDGALWVTRDGGTTWTDLFTLNEGLEPPARAQTIAFAVREEDPVQQDPLSGTWKCKAEGEGIESDEQGNFTLELSLEGGKLSGSIQSELGEGPLGGMSWDADKGLLRFHFNAENLVLEFDSKVKDDVIEGEISAAEGAFHFEFTGKRIREEEAAPQTGGQAEAGGQEPQAEESPQEAASPAESKKESDTQTKPRKFKENTIDQLLPGRRYVSSIVASRFKAGRVYVTFDGHRSDDDTPYVFVSEDYGQTWKSLQANLVDGVGCVRDIDEDLENKELLYLGTEFGAFVSIDRGASWTELGENLPTVAVHDFAQHPTRGELIAGTHGRSIWILNVTLLRQLTKKTLALPAHLYRPSDVIHWRRGPSRGSSGTRRFVGANPPEETGLFYSLAQAADELSLVVENAAGEVVAEFPDASSEKGLHHIDWHLDRAVMREDKNGEMHLRHGGRVPTGTYTVVLTVDGERQEQSFEIKGDPNQPSGRWMEYERFWEEMEAAQQDQERGPQSSPDDEGSTDAQAQDA